MFDQLITLRNYSVLDASKRLATNPDTGHIVQMIYCGDDKLDMSYFYKCYNQLEPNVSHVIFIYNIATIQIKKLKMYKDILNIEFLNLNELKRLLTGNRFVPKHSKLSLEEQQAIIERFGKDNLPCILHSDPMVRLHDFPVDSIIQIERNDAIYYRRVMED
jgi:DNA-directed RNA polymerase subunit H (RpoH/RPB5)